MKAADIALYQAKRDGRDRVVMAIEKSGEVAVAVRPPAGTGMQYP